MRLLTILVATLALTACGGGGGSDGAAAPPPKPSINTTTVPDGRVGVSYSANIVAGGGTGAGFTWDIAAGALPPGVQLAAAASAASLSGTPTDWGQFAFTVRVTDSAGGQATAALHITVQPAQPIAINAPVIPPCVVGTAWQLGLGTTGGTGTGYQWSITAGALPPGIALTPGTPDATLQGTPTQAGSFQFTVQVTDSLGEFDTRQLTISATLPPLVVSTATLPGGDTTLAYQADIVASGGTGVSYGWAVIAGALPQGLSLTGGTPAAGLNGTPVQPGTYPFTVQVTDSAANVATRNLSLVVTGPPPLAITTTQLPAAIEQTPYSELLAATGGTPPYTWSVTQGSLPPGLSLSGDQISGTPTQPGSFPFTVQVWDSGVFTQSRAMSITVSPSTFTFTTPSALPYAVDGHAWGHQLATTGGAHPLGNWQVTSGALPPGMTLTSTRAWSAVDMARLEGTPAQMGNFQFTVQVTDAAARVASRSFTLEVRAGSGSLVIVNKDLGPWFTGGPIVPVALNAAGVTGLVFGWTVAAGSLPPGISIANPGPGTFQLEGTPTQAGTFGFTLEVADSSILPVSRAFVVEVDPATGVALCFGAPVFERTVFLLAANADMLGSKVAAMRAEITTAILSMPTGHEFDVLAFGGHFSPAQSYSLKIWGTLMPATAANKAAAVTWVNGPATNPGGGNASYAALQHACQIYPSNLRTMYYVNSSLPNTSGSASLILADMPTYWAHFQDCHFAAIGISATAASYMQQLAVLLNGAYIAA